MNMKSTFETKSTNYVLF